MALTMYKQLFNESLEKLDMIERLIESDDLSSNEAVVLIKLLISGRMQYFTANELCLPQRTVYKVLDDLTQKGYLTKVKKGYACNVDYLCNEINNDIDRVALHAPKSRTTRGNDQSDSAVMEGQSQIDQPKPEKAKRSVFQVPTLLEVEQEFFEKTNDRDFAHMTAVKFWNFYDAKGWMVGKTKMQRWKSAVMTWLNKEQIQVAQPQSDYDENGNFIRF